MPHHSISTRPLPAILLALSLATANASPLARQTTVTLGAMPATLTLNEGKRWPTDAPLRKAMGNVRASMDAALHPIHEGKFAAAQYRTLARNITSEVNDMVSNCRLEPKADAQLHLVIARLLEGAEAMDGKTKGAKRVDGAVKVLGALENYGNHFDDPSWKPIKH